MSEKQGRAEIQKWKEQNPELAKESLRKGQAVSAQKRREKRTFKELLSLALETQDDSGLSNKEKMVYSIIEKAISGDNKSFEIIRDTIGEQLAQQIEVSAKNKINIKIDGDKS